MAKSNPEALTYIEVVPYDPAWAKDYQSEQRLITSVLPALLFHIEHIGSTAVPGLRAKPIIDIMAAVNTLSDALSAQAQLAQIGYVLIETGMENRLFFRKATAEGKAIHLHVVEVQTWEERKERLMRDYLLGHPDAVEAYGRLKDELAKTYAEDSLAYTKAKTDFIQALMNKACDERGLPRIDVWTDKQQL